MLVRADFPNGFVFGAATSAYQIEGSNFGNCGPSHWDQFAAQPGKVINGESGAVACDHYHRYEADLDLLRGLDAYRFSTNWARVLPMGRGQVNQAGLDFYDRLVDAILARGLDPFLTLYHWDLPADLADKGGWTNPDIAQWFGEYTEVVLGRIGDRVASVSTLNEPWCIAWLSHFLGQHAPGLRNITAAARAMHHVLTAHGESLQRMRARGQKNLGIVLNFEHIQSMDNSPQSGAAATRSDAIFNQWFIGALTKGTYPDAALQGLEPHLPKGWQGDMAQISQPLDWLGVNYYTRQIVADAPGAPWPGFRAIKGTLPKTDMGWEIYPQGLRALLTRLKADYTGDLPIYITENGMAWADRAIHGKVNDPERWRFVQDHLQQLRHALDDGVNICGYFYWSLLDNYEWAYGYDKRFGLVHVDFESQKRTPKQSYHQFMAAFATQG